MKRKEAVRQIRSSNVICTDKFGESFFHFIYAPHMAHTLDSPHLMMTVEGASFTPNPSAYLVQVEARGHSPDYM